MFLISGWIGRLDDATPAARRLVFFLNVGIHGRPRLPLHWEKVDFWIPYQSHHGHMKASWRHKGSRVFMCPSRRMEFAEVMNKNLKKKFSNFLQYCCINRLNTFLIYVGYRFTHSMRWYHNKLSVSSLPICSPTQWFHTCSRGHFAHFASISSKQN